MIIRILEDGPIFKKGIKNLSDRLALELIAKGIAVKCTAVDKEAHEALQNARTRDKQQGR